MEDWGANNFAVILTLLRSFHCLFTKIYKITRKLIPNDRRKKNTWSSLRKKSFALGNFLFHRKIKQEKENFHFV